MAGKTRPSLMKKTLSNVVQSNLSITDKKCIGEVFAKFEELTNADVVEVVRCKDCKYLEQPEEFELDTICRLDNKFVELNDFCSYGERRET